MLLFHEEAMNYYYVVFRQEMEDGNSLSSGN
jgi:hypothetical protein